MLNITIPKPCHEDWDQMTPGDHGRHCGSCMKTVIDFSNMSDDEVKNFLVNKKEEKLCGRFSIHQLQTIQIELPQNIFQLQMPLWKQFLLACLIAYSAMLFSCEVKHDGLIAESGSADLRSGRSLKAAGAGYEEYYHRKYEQVRVGMFGSKDTIYEDTTTEPVPMLPDTSTQVLMGITIPLMSDSAMAMLNAYQKDTTIDKPKCIRSPAESIGPSMLNGEIQFVPLKPVPKKKETPKSDSLKCEDFS